MENLGKLVVGSLMLGAAYYISCHSYEDICDKAKSFGKKIERKKLARALEKKGYYITKDGKIFVKAEVIAA